MVKMTDSIDSTIADIMQKYPEDEWLDRCHKALPDVDDGVILSAFEIFSEGDVQEL